MSVSRLQDQLQHYLAGRYTIERELGQGGMATVYLARDLKHERLVAVKLLNPELSHALGAERFLAEIGVTARLQHPNLLALFDSGTADGLLYYVMPYAEGESLRTRLEREGQLPVDEAIRIASDVADALDYAHSHGVVHRDLKPENILLQHGRPVVADFGIALAVREASGPRMTETGVSLGTPQYMSPEQAAGDRMIDGRSDIYALGAILYEMLSGEPPHAGPTVQAIISRVVTERPPRVRTRRAAVPVHVDRAIDRALAKVPADRFTTARQFNEALREPAPGSELAPIDSEGAGWRIRPMAMLGAAAVLILAGGAASSLISYRQSAPPSRIVRFTLALPPGTRLASYFGSPAEISPDGRRIAFVGPPTPEGEIWLREIDKEQGYPVPGSVDAFEPRFSPDGQWIIWFNAARLTWMRAPIGGGPTTPVVRTAGPMGFDWYKNDSIVIAPQGIDGGGHLYATSVGGGALQRFLRDDSSAASTAQWNPVMAPDARTVLFVSRRRDARGNHDELAYATLDERRVHTLSVTARNILGYAAGAIVYAEDDGSIMAVRFDLDRRATTGVPLRTNERAQIDAFGLKASLSRSGDLVYRGGPADARVVLVNKQVSPVQVIADSKDYSYPRYSPDGRRIALALFTGRRTDIWVYHVASSSIERLTADGTDNERPEWSADGKYILYRSNRSGQQAIWRQLADGTGAAVQISPRLTVPAHEGVLSPDGRVLLYRVDDPNSARYIFSVALEGNDRTPHPFANTEFDELAPRFSPDGRWVAYVSNESGRDEVYVRGFPGPSGKVLVSSGGGDEPLWSRDGGRIFYRGTDVVVVSTVSLKGTPSIMARDTVVVGPYLPNRFHPMYDVDPDSRGLLMLDGVGPQLQLTVVLDWSRALANQLKRHE